MFRYQWTRQPQYPTNINWSNPLTNGLVSAIPLSGHAFDLVKGKTYTPVGGVTYSSNLIGKALQGNLTDAGIDLGTADFVSGYPITVAMWFQYIGDNSLYVHVSLSGTNYRLVIGEGANKIYFGITASPGYFGIAGLTAGKMYHMIYTVMGSVSHEVFLNGVRLSLTEVGNNWGEPSAGNHSLGYRKNGSTPRYIRGQMSDVLIYNRRFSDAEAMSLYTNHWQIFQP